MQTGLGSGDLRSALIQKLAQAQSGPASAFQRIGNKLGSGVTQQARLQALIARAGAGRTPNVNFRRFGENHRPAHGEQDPMSVALGGPQRGHVDPVEHRGANLPDPMNQMQGGPQRGHQASPDIQSILDLFQHVDPSHYQTILAHLSSLIGGEGNDNVVAQPAHPGGMQQGQPQY